MKMELVARLAQNSGGQARGRQTGNPCEKMKAQALTGQLPGYSDSLTAEGLSMPCHWCYLAVVVWRPGH
jgi:hypothetical protein